MINLNHLNITALVGKTADADNNNINNSVKNTKIIASLKYLSNFWRSLEMPLINCKILLESNWIEDSTKLKITVAKLRVPIVTFSTKDNVNLTKQLSDGFKRSVYWNKYQIIPAKVIETEKDIYELLPASFQGIKRLFVLAYTIAAGAANNESDIKNRKYFLPRTEIKNYNVFIDGRNFYNHRINDFIKQYDEVTKVSTGQGDDYTTGCLLDYALFEDIYSLTAVGLSKQKAVDADPRAVQQIVFQGVVGGADGA